jgi:hypothetical protein
VIDNPDTQTASFYARFVIFLHPVQKRPKVSFTARTVTNRFPHIFASTDIKNLMKDSKITFVTFSKNVVVVSGTTRWTQK